MSKEVNPASGCTGPSDCWQPTDCFCRPEAKQSKCHICHKPFAMDQKGWRKTVVMVREHRVSWFRGDDVVEFAHPFCVANAAPHTGAVAPSVQSLVEQEVNP